MIPRPSFDTRALLRQRLTAEIEERIAILDLIDGDPDCEPSLGWSKTMAWGNTTDLELDTAENAA